MNQDELKSLYSNNLKAIKKSLALTTNELSDKLNIPARTIGSYERKENLCSAQLVTELCQKLNINANWFVTGQGEMFNAQEFGTIKNDLRREVLQILKDEGLIK